MNPGKVYLVGAGPGDPELLTLKAVKALKRAEVLLCDDLVHEDVLAYARPDARVVHVGKRGGAPSTSQAFIQRLMIAEARRGRTVVRLKGGDPMVFGRGGEECAALRAAEIDFEIVPGITSGLAAATELGIALTHRDSSPGVVFVTGHRRAEGGPAVEWAALARSGLSLVIYMGVARSDEIRRSLIDGGLAPSTPAAVVRNATRRDRQAIATTLDRLVDDIRAAKMQSPAIIIVGEAARVPDECLARSRHPQHARPEELLRVLARRRLAHEL